MRLTAPPPLIDPDVGFTGENDIFDLAAFGVRLSNIIVHAPKDDSIFLLDGAWGTGKSTFMSQWAGSLCKDGWPVIMFDAFENDYQDDTFLILASEIQGLAARRNVEPTKLKKYKDQALKAAAFWCHLGLGCLRE